MVSQRLAKPSNRNVMGVRFPLSPLNTKDDTGVMGIVGCYPTQPKGRFNSVLIVICRKSYVLAIHQHKQAYM